MLGKNKNMSNFEVVHITNIYKRNQKIQCTSFNDDMEHLNENSARVENIEQLD